MTTNRKRIQAYVNLSTYEFLKSQAEDKGISLSELVGEILHTQTLPSSSPANLSSNDSYVTKDQLFSVIDELRRDLDRQIIREVNKAELQWEANANTITAINHSVFELMANPESMENALAKSKAKGKK